MFKHDRSSTATGSDKDAELDRTCDMSIYSLQKILARYTELIDYHAGLGQAYHAQGQRRTISLNGRDVITIISIGGINSEKSASLVSLRNFVVHHMHICIAMVDGARGRADRAGDASRALG